MRIARTVLVSIAWLSGTVAHAGALAGVVVDDKGLPIPNATVPYHSVTVVTRSASGQRIISGPSLGSSVKTAADGSFSISGLPAATYHLCAYGTQSNHLGSCEWGQGTLSVNLAAAQTVQLKFVVAQGTLLTFQVQDPKHQVVDLESLPTINGRMPLTGANFSIGVWAGTRYVRAKLLSVSGATRLYQLAIPKTASIRLHLDTSLRVADASGEALALRQPSTTIAAGGQSEVVINLAIP